MSTAEWQNIAGFKKIFAFVSVNIVTQMNIECTKSSKNWLFFDHPLSPESDYVIYVWYLREWSILLVLFFKIGAEICLLDEVKAWSARLTTIFPRLGGTEALEAFADKPIPPGADTVLL